MTFRANWMNSQSFCKSFGMDLVALESEHEKNYFIKSSENNIEIFEEYVHIGGVFAENDWISISSNKKLGFDLNLEKVQIENSTDLNCLQLRRSSKKLSFSRVQCFGNKLQQFICQKMIWKEKTWTNIFGK